MLMVLVMLLVMLLGKGVGEGDERLLEDRLALLVALRLVDCVLVEPADPRVAALAEDVAHLVHPRQHVPLLDLREAQVHHLVEQHRLPR